MRGVLKPAHKPLVNDRAKFVNLLTGVEIDCIDAQTVATLDGPVALLRY
jgi:hypothetical protein